MATQLLDGAATTPTLVPNDHPLGIAPGTPIAPPVPVQPAMQAPAPIQPVSLPHPSDGLDPKIVTLAQSIRQVESGGNFQAAGKSGEYGAYQFMPDTWNATAPKYGVNVPLQQATPAQQNEVAYKQLSDWSAQHPDWNVGNFASAWNAGPGKPNAYLEGNAGTNSQGVSYDTAAYAKQVAETYQSLKAQNPNLAQPSIQTPSQPAPPPSIGGFLGNVVSSGANFGANTLNAVLHPIQTVQNIGGAAVGGLQELAGAAPNENTAKADSIKNYFEQRYGGISNVEHSLYTDPVGVLADLSAALGLGAGAAGVVGKLGELSTVADASRAGELAAETGLRTMAGDTASGNALTRTAAAAQDALGAASKYTNPFTPIVAGTGALLNKGSSTASFFASQATGLDRATIAEIISDPSKFTPEQIAGASRAGIAQDIESALQTKEAALSETGSSYAQLRETPTPIQTAPNFLDNAFRKGAGIDVEDGVIKSNSSSAVRSPADIAKLQGIYNLYKPDFLNGTMDSNKFLNLRSDLAEKANFGNGLTKNLERAAAGIREDLNSTYRGQISGLSEKDAAYSVQKPEFDRLRKGFLDREGNLQESAVNKIANAGGKGKDALLARLEEISPGITKRLQIQKAIEDIQRSGENKVGAYARALEPGGAVVALATGHIGIAAGAIAALVLSNPNVAVPLIRLFGANKELVAAVTSKLAQSANLPTVLDAAANQQSDSANPQAQEVPTSPAEPQSTPVPPENTPQPAQ